jgi:hypothetical protein
MVVTNPLAVGPAMRIISDLRLQYWIGKSETEPHHVGPRGGTADASVLGADVRKDVGVRFSPRPVLLSIRPETLAGNSFDTSRQGGTIG